MLFKIAYYRNSDKSKKQRCMYCFAEGADLVQDYMSTTTQWWDDAFSGGHTIVAATPVADDDPEYTAWVCKTDADGFYINEPYVVPCGWITRTHPEVPKRYYYRTTGGIYRDYTELRWAATPRQQEIMETGGWKEIDQEEAVKKAHDAARWQKDHKHPRGCHPDDEYIYPAGITADSYKHLRYHTSMRIVDYQGESQIEERENA